MGSSYRIGRFLGIDVRVHMSFGLLVAFVLWTSVAQTGSMVAAVLQLLFVFGLFGFVVMHEYGHALAARYYGVKTREITLYPIGGVAMLERMPESPREQLVIALAGPAVNFLLAALLFPLALSTNGSLSLGVATLSELLVTLMVANLTMGLFNLLPALPMDGGRVLRAFLQMRMEPQRATRIAARVAKVVAGLMALYAFAPPMTLMLLLIAAFVWSASSAEVRASQAEFGGRSDPRAPAPRTYTAAVVGPDGKVVHNPLIIEQNGVAAPAGGAGQPGAGQRVVARVVDGPDGPRVHFVRQ